MEVTNSMKMDKFDGKNFRQWKFQISCALKAKGLNINKPKPEDNATQWLKDDGMAMFILTSSMDLNQISLVENCETALQVMTKLESIYEQKSEFNKMMVHEKFYQYKMSAGDSIAQHISKVENLAKQLKESGEELSETAIMTKILSTLPPAYRSLRQAWLSMSSESQTIQNLTSRLIDEEASLTHQEDSESALVAAKQSGRGKPNEQNIERKGYTSQTRHRFICYNCNKRGHFARECRAPKKSGRKPQEQNNNMLAFNAEHAMKGESGDDEWILDSGASVHMTYRREYFHELQEYHECNSNRTVKLGNKKEIEVHGQGSILIDKWVDGQWERSTLTDVLFVPELRRNLISEGAITRRGYVIVKEDRRALILRNNILVMCARLTQNNLYQLNIKPIVQENCNIVQTSLKVWHERLGHLNIKEIQNMCKTGAIPVTLTDTSKFICEACQYGKQSRLPFKKSARGKMLPGDLTYSDVCGPIEHQSVSGMKYFVLFKDAATSHRYVYFLRNKYEVFESFKKYNAIVKNMYKHSVKILHTDNGREYVNREFKAFLDKEGIVHECSAPYTPEQNGRAEREMRTIIESARSMLYARDIPLNLWAEAVNCAVYLLNRGSSSQTNISPYELWTGQKPNLQHIKIFGSEGYVHVPKEKRKKLDKKSNKMMLVGYDNENYRMYDINTRNITISRNVIFNENNVPLTRKNILQIHINEEEQTPCTSTLLTPAQSELPDGTSSPNETIGSEYDSLKSDENDETFEPSQIISSDEESRNVTLRPRRDRNAEANITEINIPNSYEEAINSEDSQKWKEAIKEELQAHANNNTWTVTERPQKKTITSKWVFCVKKNEEGNIVRYKARLCARGFTQVKDIDYTETFSPTTRYDSIRIMLSTAAREQYEIPFPNRLLIW